MQFYSGECYIVLHETALKSHLKRHTNVSTHERTGLTTGTRLIITDITYTKGLQTNEAQAQYGLSQSRIIFQNAPIVTLSITNVRFQNDDETVLSYISYTL
jgi:hypothetical protein